MIQRSRGRALHLALPLLLSACAHAPTHRTPAAPPTPATPSSPGTVLPRNGPDAMSVPDAVPRIEPRSVYGNPPFYEVAGRRYVVLPNAAGYVERGVASWYGTEFHGLRTSTGEPYDMFAMTAAHKTLPLPCYARVTNLANGRSVVVRINDRGPFVATRIIDLSYTAAVKLDMIRNGTAFVQVETLTPGTTLTEALPVNAPAAAEAAVGLSSVPAVSSSSAAAEVVSAAPVADSSPPPAAAAAGADNSAVAAGGSAATPASAPPPLAAAPSVAAPSAGGATFYIQVGAYGSADNARRAAQKLRDAGLGEVFTLAPDAHQPLQRVRIGPIVSVQQFDQSIARLAALGFNGARLAQD